jgi:hypothetical protein
MFASQLQLIIVAIHQHLNGATIYLRLKKGIQLEAPFIQNKSIEPEGASFKMPSSTSVS